MKRIAFLMLSLLCYYNLKAQNRNNPVELTKGGDTIICYKCDLGNSKAVTELTQLIQDKKYTEIKKLMLSPNAAKRFLAAVTTKKLLDLKKVTVNGDENKLIDKIYSSKDTIYTYSNDTYIQIQPIRYFIFNKKERIIWNQTQSWLEKALK